MKAGQLQHFKWSHIAWWVGLYLLWLIIFQNHTFTFSRTVTVQFCYLLFIAANYYWNIFFTVPRFLYRERYALFGFSVLAGITVASLLRVPLAIYLNRNFFHTEPPGVANLFFASFINIFIWTICILAGKLLSDRFRFQQYVTKLEQQKMKTELDFLNAQFNPHFLFNSIHSIYGHIDKNNGAARRMLLSFSEMLRYQLYECNTDSIGIDKETAYIRNYVALQQARKEPGLDVKLEISEKVTGFRIAPLLFIAFIENAFKYVGSENEKPQWIHICFNLSDQQLIFRCINSKDDMLRRPIDHKGIGIANTKRRLELLYPGAHTLTINALPATYEIILQLKMS